MADAPWSFVCDDGSTAQGVLRSDTFNVLTLTLSGRLMAPEQAGPHDARFDGRPARVVFAVDVVTSALDVRSIEVSTDLSAAEEARLTEALTRAFTATPTLQDLLDRLESES